VGADRELVLRIAAADREAVQVLRPDAHAVVKRQFDAATDKRILFGRCPQVDAIE
jgi:hypothetical protein